MKQIIFVSLFLLMSLMSYSQTSENVYTPNTKCNVELNQYLHHLSNKQTAIASNAYKHNSDNKVSLVIYCNNRDAVEQAFNKMGISSSRITGTTLTAQMLPSQIETVANLEAVKRITGMQHRQLHMDKARTLTNTDDVHNGAQLETPYTGRGVVIGIIDQGFQYDHPAFRVSNDSTRITAIWNTAEKGPVYGSKRIIAAGNDGKNESHATHVTGIAAGDSTLGSKTFFGIAPDAHIVAISSNDFTDDDILNGINLIKQVATKLHEPFVVNMSFGSNYGSHDGSDDLDNTLDTLSKHGGIFVCSAGNDGSEKLHAAFDFKEDNDTCLIAVKHNSADNVILYILSDDKQPITVSPFFYNISTKTVLQKTKLFWSFNDNEFESQLNTNNKRYYYSAIMPVANDLKGITDTGNYYFMFKVTGHAGHHFDAFLVGNNAVFTSIGNGFVSPTYDNTMCIGSPADTYSAITVGSYNSRLSWQTLDSKTYSYSGESVIGKLSSFSSVGPSTNPAILKPTICAPGMGIISSINKNSTEYSSTSNTVCEKLTLGNTDYYYGIMQGTSMSAPIVTGIIALWLQANPTLTHDQILDIIQRSAIRDNFTGTTWNTSWGYGKIDAYTGLKLALKINGINNISNSAQPVTIKKSQNEWRILFNNFENFANICLFSSDGKMILNRTLTHINSGDEQIVPFSGLISGLYLLKIKTQNTTTTRKVMIR